MGTEATATDLRFPIGRYAQPGEFNDSLRRRFIEELAQAPEKLREAVRGLTPQQLDTPYRPSGWTVRQVVHHLPDSHLNAYVRCKLALTEDEPTIKAYDEKRWAELSDTVNTPVETSLALLESLHARWVTLLKSLPPGDFARTLRHPELGVMTLDVLLSLYAWHGKHHVAHISALRERMGWK